MPEKIKKDKQKDDIFGDSLAAMLDSSDVKSISVYISTKRGSNFEMDVFIRYDTLCFTLKEVDEK